MNWKEHIAATFSWLPKDPDIIWDGWGIAVVSALLGLAVAALRWLYRLRKTNTAFLQHDASDWLAKNRQPLLRRLRKDLDSRFASFLLDRSPLELTKTVAPDEVNHPRSLQDSIACILERDGTVLETTNQPVAALFDRPDVGRRLAILGKPGSGKTVCLLTLLAHLLHEAEADAAAPLPLLFECSEWDGRELPSWMAWQLHRRYAFPEDTACQLVQAGDIFPLFDGLDELAAGKQEDFIRAFNAFADNRPLVLCCRIEEYRNLRKHTGQKLSLNTALILQDISPQQIEGHLRQQGLDALREVLAQSENLMQTVQRPLFLGLMIKLTGSIREGWRRRQGETWEDCIWRLYLDQCLDEKQANWNKSPDSYGAKYSQKQSMHWLHCLARWMQKEQKVELHIDELQPTMLKDDWWFGLAYGLSFGLVFGLMNWLFTGPMLGAATGLAAGLTIMQRRRRIMIEPLRPLRLPVSWQDWHAFNAQIARWLSIGLAIGLIVGLAIGLIQVERLGLRQWLIAGSDFSLVVGLLFGLAKGLKAVSGKIIESAHPQERLKNAVLSSLLLFPLFLLAGPATFVQILFLAEWLGIAVDPFFNMRAFYMVLFMTAIFSFFLLGTNQVLQHYLLRLCLRWEGQLPFRLVP